MQKRSSIGRGDLNQVAARIVRDSTTADAVKPSNPKNSAAVALGRLGGLKGGKARAKSLTASERSDIAKKAALSRWKDKH